MSQSIDEIRTAYDLASRSYTEKFAGELEYKPKDKELLLKFSRRVLTNRRVLDLGCGPGHTTSHLQSLDLEPTGLDISPEMITRATELFPDINFRVADFFSIPKDLQPADGILAFYCIVHLQMSSLRMFFEKLLEAVVPGGTLLLAFHSGDETVVAEDFLDSGRDLIFYAFPSNEVQGALIDSGWSELETVERKPYKEEYPSTRCYIFAKKPMT